MGEFCKEGLRMSKLSFIGRLLTLILNAGVQPGRVSGFIAAFLLCLSFLVGFAENAAAFTRICDYLERQQPENEDLIKDCLVLERFYNRTGGPDWSYKSKGFSVETFKWGAPKILPNQWYGVYVKNNRIAGLDLGGNNVVGDVSSLAYLQDLEEMTDLRLDGNSLSGTLPDLGYLTKLQRLYLHDNRLTGPGTTGLLNPDLNSLVELSELSLWGNDDPVGEINLADGVTSSVVDRAALRVLHDANGGPGWNDRSGWLSSLPLGQWHGVTVNSEGRVTQLNLSGNGLKNALGSSLEALTALTSINLSNNRTLSGALPERLRHIRGIVTLDIRCTGVETPGSGKLYEWLKGLDSFLSGCQSPSQTPPSTSSSPPTLDSGSTESSDSGFADSTPVAEPVSPADSISEPEIGSGGGGCIISPGTQTGNVDESIALNLILIMSVLLAAVCFTKERAGNQNVSFSDCESSLPRSEPQLSRQKS